jgi:hypothetical protein
LDLEEYSNLCPPILKLLLLGTSDSFFCFAIFVGAGREGSGVGTLPSVIALSGVGVVPDPLDFMLLTRFGGTGFTLALFEEASGCFPSLMDLLLLNIPPSPFFFAPSLSFVIDPVPLFSISFESIFNVSQIFYNPCNEYSFLIQISSFLSRIIRTCEVQIKSRNPYGSILILCTRK